MIEVRQARYFLAVAEELHFGRAAARLHMSQSPLSQAIRQLEAQCGARLLERGNRTVALTSAGQALVPHCQILIVEAQRALRAVTRAAAGQVGTVLLGAVTSAFLDPLPVTLRRLRAAHPGIQVEARELDSGEAVRALQDRRLDLALVRLDHDVPGLTVNALRHDELIAALPSDHEAATGPPLPLRQLADEPWVLVSRAVSPAYHDEIAAACRTAGFSPSAAHHARSLHSQIAMIGCGLGVGLVPSSTAHLHLEGVSYRTLQNPPRMVELATVTRRSDPEPGVRALLAALHDER